MRLTLPTQLTITLIGMVWLGGCIGPIIERTDREVYRVIQNRQQAAIGTTTNVHIGDETGEINSTNRMYNFNPQPVDADIPESFKKKSAAASTNPEDITTDDHAENLPESTSTEEIDPLAARTESIFSEDQMNQVQVFGLANTLAYAMKNARRLQNAKEDLYVATLDLTLERHLWTPQFVATMSADFDFSDSGGVEDHDKAFTAVAEIAAFQRLKHGGLITARIVSTLVRNLHDNIVEGEQGDVILEANLPLFRGAGDVAYESRYVAERELIYAVRTYERFRRSYLVQVASDYFNLQQLKASIINTYKAFQSRKNDWEKAEFINRMGRSRTIFEAPRAKSSLRSAESSLVSAKERFASSLDRFKILIGMEVDTKLDVLSQKDDIDARKVDDLLPRVTQLQAVQAAMKYRLDLLNSSDSVDDRKRGVEIAKNRLLPDLDFSANFNMQSDPNHANSFDINPERGSWGGGFNFRLDDRKTEKNAYRRSLITVRQADRNHEQTIDEVKADVRRAMRRITQQENLRSIMAMNVQENELRAAAARAQYDLGKSTNQDVVDAENDLLDARNDYAAAIASYRVAILEFRRDTGTLRVTDDGKWADDTTYATPIDPQNP